MKTRLNQKNLTYSAVYFAIAIMIGVARSAFGPALPSLAANTNSSLKAVSVIFSLHSLGYLPGSLIGGQLLDRLPGNTLLAVVVLITSLMIFLTPVAASLWVLAAVILLMGLSGSVTDVGINALLIWLHKEGVGPYMSGLHFSFGIGAILAPILISLSVANLGSLKWVYWLLALSSIPIVIALLRFPSPPSPEKTQDKKEIITNPKLTLMISLLFLFYVAAEVALSGWIYTYTITMKLGTQISAGALNSLFWVALTVSRLLSVPIVKKVKPIVILFSNLTGILISMTAMLLWQNSIPIHWISTLSVGFFMGSTFPMIMTMAERRMTINGKVTGLFFAATGPGAMFLPWLIGQYFETIGPHFMVISVIIAFALALCMLIIIGTRYQQKYETIH